MSTGPIRVNAVLDLHSNPEALVALNALVMASKGKGEGRIKCTVTKHRVAKTAIILGIQLLSRKPPTARTTRISSRR